MLKRCLLSMVLAFVLLVSFCSASFADTLPPVPTMTLTVAQLLQPGGPMAYTAQLSYIPTGDSNVIVNFYSTSVNNPQGQYILIGSAPIDGTGKAVLNKQMQPGLYSAYSSTVISGNTVKSNTVDYTVK